MKIYIAKLVTVFAAALVSAGCTKTLEMDYDEIEPLMVVEGHVSNNGMKVYVRKHSNMTDTVSKDGVPDAVVSITGSDGFEENLEYGDGFYFSPTNAKGVAGVTYTLNVEWQGKACRAESTMPDLVPIDSVSWEWMPIINDIEIRIAKIYLSDKQDEENYYYLDIVRDDRIMNTAAASDWGLTDKYNYLTWAVTSKNTQEDEEEELKKTGKRKVDYIYGGDKLKISLRTIDWNAYHYFSTMGENSKGVNPESNLQGSDGVVGYFSAYSVSHVDEVYPHVDE